jgi:hypothetical protein
MVTSSAENWTGLVWPRILISGRCTELCGEWRETVRWFRIGRRRALLRQDDFTALHLKVARCWTLGPPVGGRRDG